MDRIEAIPGRGCRNYRDFSRLTNCDEPSVDLAYEHASVGQSEFAARKKHPPEELKSTFAESFDAADGHLRNERRRVEISDPIEAAFYPFEHLLGRNTIQHIVADVGYERRGWEWLATL